MGQLVFTAPDVQMTSFYQIKGDKMTSTTATATSVFSVTGIPEGAVVRRATYSATLGNPDTGAQVMSINGEDARSFMGGNATIRMSVRSNRDVTVAFTFKCRGNKNKAEGMYPQTMTIRDQTLTIVYDEDQYVEPPPEPRMVLVPKKTVKLFSARETDFTGNGLCILSPMSCVVSEEAGGSYELEMQHPIDEYGKWELIQEDCVIEAPIPPTYLPATDMPPWERWRTNKETSLYTTLPSYTKAKNDVEGYYAGDKIISEWVRTQEYPSNHYVIRNGNIYMSGRRTLGEDPETSGIWAYVGPAVRRYPSSYVPPQYNPGVIKETLPEGELVYKISDYNKSWMQVRSLRGITGYVLIADCTKEDSADIVTEPARTLYTQLFRVYEVGGEDDTHSITVKARHISYDLQKNMLYDVQLEECPPATAIALVTGSMVNDDETMMRWGDMEEPTARKIMTNLTEPLVTCNWSFQNPIQALLDPDEGFAGKVKGKVIRDNADIFILDNNAPRRGISMTYGVNLRGVKWTRNMEDVITRIIPRAKDTDDTYIYLTDLFIDSEAIGDYAVIATEILDSEYKVGQQITHLDGTKSDPLTKDQVMERMRSEAEDRFYVDHCDAVTVSLDVEFLLLGDTEEYKQYRNLQRVQLYDLITIDTGPTALKTTAQVSGYEWDCLMGRYNSISIGRVFKQSRRRLPGYRLASGAITYSKLAPDLITYIKGAE